MPSITAEDIVKLFEEDAKARKRLAELLISEPDVRLAIISAVLRDVATKGDVESLRKEIEALRAETKSDIEALRKEFKSDVEALRREFREEMGRLGGRIDDLERGLEGLERRIDGLEQRVSRLEGSISLFTKLFVAFNLPLLVSVIAALVALLLRAP